MFRELLPVLCCLLPLAAAELPVREVVLYKHGVGYFERSGTLAPGESARLDFKAGEMNDVLKSLTVRDSTGSKVTGLRYDSSQPVALRLEDFPFRIDEENPSLAGFLNQLKGARVELRGTADKVAGTVMSARVVAGDERRPERQELVLLLDSGEVRTFDLQAVSGISFADPKLQAQLREYLRVLADARSTEKRSVYLDSIDASRRQVTASYMIPAPVWKSSYRLIFDDKAGSTLEGWAIVDNTTGDDWVNVNLALVSGRPISFVSQLYEPRYRHRPGAELPEEQAAAPVVHEGGVVGGVIAGAPREMARQGRFKAAAPPPPPVAAQMPSASPMVTEALDVSASSVAVNTASRELGELFEYRFSSPVTVKRGESAMLPFLQQKVATRKLLILSDPTSAHPMNAAEITNSTAKTLDGGPITVFDAGAYAGEALMETLKAGDKRLISYAIDLGTRVASKFGTTAMPVREIHVRRGVLEASSAYRETRTYDVRNVDAKPKTLVIEHALRSGYRIVSPQPLETTRSAHRFELKLPASAGETLTVVEERDQRNTMALSSLTPDALLVYVENQALSAAARKQLEAVLALKRRLAENQRAAGDVRSRISSLERDQDRLRQNMESLNRVSGQQEQVQKYARALADQETRLAELRTREGELDQQRAALESELASLIEKLDF